MNVVSINLLVGAMLIVLSACSANQRFETGARFKFCFICWDVSLAVENEIKEKVKLNECED